MPAWASSGYKRVLDAMLDQIKSWFHLAEIGQSRSSITNPLQWGMVILIGGVVLSLLVKAPPWITGILMAFFAGVGLLFLYAYAFFMHKNPDVLRSEHFHLHKLAIERGLIGDSLKGLAAADEPEALNSRLLTGKSEGEGLS